MRAKRAKWSARASSVRMWVDTAMLRGLHVALGTSTGFYPLPPPAEARCCSGMLPGGAAAGGSQAPQAATGTCGVRRTSDFCHVHRSHKTLNRHGSLDEAARRSNVDIHQSLLVNHQGNRQTVSPCFDSLARQHAATTIFGLSRGYGWHLDTTPRNSKGPARLLIPHSIHSCAKARVDLGSLSASVVFLARREGEKKKNEDIITTHHSVTQTIRTGSTLSSNDSNPAICQCARVEVSVQVLGSGMNAIRGSS